MPILHEFQEQENQSKSLCIFVNIHAVHTYVYVTTHVRAIGMLSAL